MNNPEQIDFSALARIMVPPGDDAELVRQLPAFSQKPSGLGVIQSKLFSLEIQKIDTTADGYPHGIRVQGRIRDNQPQTPDVVQNRLSKRKPFKGVFLACPTPRSTFPFRSGSATRQGSATAP